MIEMCNRNLLVRETKLEDTKENGLYLPSSALEELQVADGVIEETFDEVKYTKGSRIFFHKVSPVDVRMERNGESKLYWFVNEQDVLCIL